MEGAETFSIGSGAGPASGQLMPYSPQEKCVFAILSVLAVSLQGLSRRCQDAKIRSTFRALAWSEFQNNSCRKPEVILAFVAMMTGVEACHQPINLCDTYGYRF